MSTCARCGGKDGAHYLACFLQMAGQTLGEDYPLHRPRWLTARPTKAAIEQAKRELRAYLDTQVTVTDRPKDVVPEPVLAQAFNRWNAATAVPLSETRLKKYMAELLPDVERTPGSGGRNPAAYVGLRLEPPPLSKAEQARLQTEEIRRLAGKSPNNGWVQPAKQGYSPTDAWTPPVEEAKPKTRASKALAGEKPGKELPQEYRELIEPLLRQPGWTYSRTGGSRRGKPRITNPAGLSFTLPNTPSDWRGVLNTRASLRNRLGADL